MVKRRVFVLGAGLAGLSAAWHLQRKGIDCAILEKEPEVGGLCRSRKINGFTFDCDGHLLHFKHRSTFDFIKGLLENNLVEYKRSSWVYSHGCYTRYPFQAKLHGLPPPIIKDCLLGFLEISKNGHPKEKKFPTFLGWINHTFGKGIARHFMIPYNTKFWTLPPEELTCGWLDGHIPVPSLNEVIEGTIEDNKRQFGYNANFWYPKTGSISSLPLAFASEIKNIRLGCQITAIDVNKKEMTLSSGDKEKFDYLISTLPLPDMLYLARGLSKQQHLLLKKLRWNSIFNLNLGIGQNDYSGRHWIYFPEKEICFFRVGFFNNFSSCLAPEGKSSMYAEVSYFQEKPIDKSKIILRIKKDLKKVGLLTADTKIYAQDINDIKYGYPIYDKNYGPARERILGFLLNKNIIPCGRYGSWRYMSIEESILDGREVTKYFL